MKTILLVTTIFMTMLSFQKGPETVADKKLTATFMGSNDDGEYKYKDANGTMHVFQELGDDVDYDLVDDEYIGKKFAIVWEVAEADEYDDEGEATGETYNINRIISLSIAK